MTKKEIVEKKIVERALALATRWELEVVPSNLVELCQFIAPSIDARNYKTLSNIFHDVASEQQIKNFR